ncbi:MAG TPA: glycosyltransferase family 39 protein [Candidatus Tumulicola sp.]|nr:glycosyltransferase family 39 protein [Candidatus Tumulicola sp.]
MIALLFAAAALLLHGATAWRYGYFRDELYFIACSKHPAWGYVDQPPLVVAAAALAAPAHYDLLALRALPIVAAAATALVVVLLARELGGGRFAQILAGTTAVLAPAYLLLGSTLTTTSFEPLCWTLTIYAAVRVVRGGGTAWWVAAALTVALGAYAKYSIALPVTGIVTGLALTPQRSALRAGGVGLAIAIVLALTAPNLWWQGAHGWPIFDVLRGDAAHRPALRNGLVLESVDFVRNALSFAAEQFVYTNPCAAPVWIAGLAAPWRWKSLRDLRFVPIAYAVVCAIALAAGAKGYYVVGLYGALFAIGAVAVEGAARAWRYGLLAAIVTLALASLPLSLPVLSAQGLITYARALGLTGRSGTTPHLIQPVFAEEFGWDRLARDVAAVYRALPSGERAQAAVYADTYADAAALDFFGPRYGLPPAISSQNSYYLWGTRGQSGRILVAVGATRIDRLRKYYRSVTLVRTSDEPMKWEVEGPAPIYLCRDPVAPLSRFWPDLRWYGA